ncbi:MAG: hypothetical protein ABJN69_13965 [Hellea sp.]
MTLPLKISAYKPRHFIFDRIWECGGVKFKAYLVTIDSSHAVPTEMIDNAKSYIDLTLPAIRQQEGCDHGLGYVVLHMGEMGNWLLIHWWAYEDIALRMLASSELGNTVFKSEDHRRFHACVWEHVVIDHERNAWVDKAMSDTGHEERYLQDRLDNGDY